MYIPSAGGNGALPKDPPLNPHGHDDFCKQRICKVTLLEAGEREKCDSVCDTALPACRSRAWLDAWR
jgi:hypothetical protein